MISELPRVLAALLQASAMLADTTLGVSSRALLHRRHGREPWYFIDLPLAKGRHSQSADSDLQGFGSMRSATTPLP